MFKVLTIFGTRPEAIKLAPVLIELKKNPGINSLVCVTAQHRRMLDQVLNIFDITTDVDLDLMRPDQSLSDITSRVITKITDVLNQTIPDLVLVQGDTTTVMASSLAAFYQNIPMGHVEAGLRSDNINSPFPEEMNRRITGLAARYHFAPTETARRSLLKEGADDNTVFVTGNPVIDALQMILEKPAPVQATRLLDKIGVNSDKDSKKLILVTAHRRENFGQGIENICNGLKELVSRNKDIVILYPVHLNPNIQKPVKKILGTVERVFLIEPVEYDFMAHLMNASYMVLTDSGGIQEEAPALGKPVLVMRTETERPEGIAVGTAKLIGINKDNILLETEGLLTDEDAYNQMACKVNPYGDGQAAKRIAKIVAGIQQE